jgi:hypothetical protein
MTTGHGKGAEAEAAVGASVAAGGELAEREAAAPEGRPGVAVAAAPDAAEVPGPAQPAAPLYKPTASAAATAALTSSLVRPVRVMASMVGRPARCRCRRPLKWPT